MTLNNICTPGPHSKGLKSGEIIPSDGIEEGLEELGDESVKTAKNTDVDDHEEV